MLEIQKKLSNSFLAILSLPATAMGFALSVQISALSWILSTQYHLEIEDIGLVWAAGPIAGILGQVIIGVVSDGVWFWGGRRRPFILVGGILAALMLLALPNIGIVSSTLGLDGILGVAILIALTLDLAINVSFNPTRSIIADVTPEGVNRTRGYTWMQTISGSFGVLAYGIGGYFDNYILIYFGAVLVLLFSLVPTFFITEPRQLHTLAENEDNNSNGERVSLSDFSFAELVLTIRPLWGFFLYAVYGMTLRLANIQVDGHWVELFCLLLTLGLLLEALLKKEEKATSLAEKSRIGFQKVLAANSFNWIGVQTMFIYNFAFLSQRIPQLSNDVLGSINSYGFFFLSLISAILPAFVLEPIARKIGKTTTQWMAMAIMAIGYVGILLFVDSALSLYVLMCVVGIGWGATVSLPFAIMSEKIDQKRMGLYMGLFNLSIVLPQLTASLGIGQLVGAAEDKSIIYMICAGSLAVSAIAWALVREPKAGSVASVDLLVEATDH